MNMKVMISLILLAARPLRADARCPPEPRPPPRLPSASPACMPPSGRRRAISCVRLFETEAPITVQNFVDLARGTKAWKDPKTGQMVKRLTIPRHDLSPRDQGFYDPGRRSRQVPARARSASRFPEEFVPTLKFDQPGRLGMAKATAPHTGQFAVFHNRGSHSASGRTAHGVRTGGGRPGSGEQNRARANEVERQAGDPGGLMGIIFKREGPVPPGGVVMRGITPAKKAPAARKSPPAAKK